MSLEERLTLMYGEETATQLTGKKHRLSPNIEVADDQPSIDGDVR